MVWLLLLFHLLYVADRREVVHVYDEQHRLLRSIPMGHQEKPRGLAAVGGSMYMSAGQEVLCLDLATEKVRWRTPVEGAPCDRLDANEDFVYVPSGFNSQSPSLFILDARDGKLLRRVTQDIPRQAHNCLVLGDRVLLAGLGSPWMGIYSADMRLERRFTFSDNVRPYTLDAGMQHLFANLDNLLGFEVMELATGKLTRVEVPAIAARHPPHHLCPSHGLGLTPDGRELWVVDSASDRLFVFDAHSYELLDTLALSGEPGWLNFSLDGRYAYPSDGEVIEVATRKVVGNIVASEKILEIKDGRVGKQYGLGY